MPGIRRGLAITVAVGATLALAACSAATAPTWTFPVASPATGGAPLASTPAAQPVNATTGGPIEIDAFDLGFKPSALTVPTPGRYAVTFRNTGSTAHDLTFADGTRIAADAGQTATGQVEVPVSGATFICSVPGHAQAGMSGSITVAGASTAGSGGSSGMAGMAGMNMPGMSMSPTSGSAAGSAAAPPSPDPNAPAPVEFDPVAPAVLPGTVHDVDMPIIEKDITVGTGYVVHAWTFGGQVPGPTIRVHLGDTIRVHLHNQTQMSHSIDFHASQTAMNDQMVEIKPGASFTYTFTAAYAGVWMYHCGTAPALDHIANGMFGMVIVEPRGGLPRVDREYAFVQSEWYLGAQGQPIDYAKANAAAPAPDLVVFNGVANQYKDNPISVPTRGRIRVFVLDAGPNIDSSFHVVGTIFDTVIKEGMALVRGNAGGWGAQAVDLAPAQGAIIEFSPQEDGMYPFVTHAFTYVNKGAIGVFSAGDGDPKN